MSGVATSCGWHRLLFLRENFHCLMSVSVAVQAQSALEDLFAQYCTPEIYVPASQGLSSCKGPTMSLSLVPNSCTLDDQAGTITCSPASLVLTKSPGGWICHP